MKTFTRPKIFRSTDGCCICKAKSSSSRFTDSEKYEEDFEKCFQLAEERQGEICNACVLIVKRWRKLPRNTKRNWSHIVDAKAGPGNKGSNKKKSDKCPQSDEKLHKIQRKLKKKPKSSRQLIFSQTTTVKVQSRKQINPKKFCGNVDFNLNLMEEVFQSQYWKKKVSRDGVYVGREGEMMVNRLEYQEESNKQLEDEHSAISSFVESELKLLAEQEHRKDDLDEGFFDKNSTNPSSPESVKTVTDDF